MIQPVGNGGSLQQMVFFKKEIILLKDVITSHVRMPYVNAINTVAIPPGIFLVVAIIFIHLTPSIIITSLMDALQRCYAVSLRVLIQILLLGGQRFLYLLRNLLKLKLS